MEGDASASGVSYQCLFFFRDCGVTGWTTFRCFFSIVGNVCIVIPKVPSHHRCVYLTGGCACVWEHFVILGTLRGSVVDSKALVVSRDVDAFLENVVFLSSLSTLNSPPYFFSVKFAFMS